MASEDRDIAASRSTYWVANVPWQTRIESERIQSSNQQVTEPCACNNALHWTCIAQPNGQPAGCAQTTNDSVRSTQMRTQAQAHKHCRSHYTTPINVYSGLTCTPKQLKIVNRDIAASREPLDVLGRQRAVALYIIYISC